jgi:hypothetical protein
MTVPGRLQCLLPANCIQATGAVLQVQAGQRRRLQQCCRSGKAVARLAYLVRLTLRVFHALNGLQLGLIANRVGDWS